jgi:transposase
MDQLAIGRRGKGRPRTRPAAALGDKAYSSAANRAYLRKRGIKAVIPVKEDQKTHRRNRGSHGGRPPAFDAGQYKDRNTVERSKPQCCHNRGWPASLLAPSCSVFMRAA